MRILHVINSLNIGGAEKLIVDIVPLLIKKGHTVDVLLLSKRNSELVEQLHNFNVEIYQLTKKSIYNPFIIFYFFNYINKYDIIHSHLFPAFYFVALSKILFFSKTPLLLTEHSTNNRRRKYPFLKMIDRFIYKQYSYKIAISKGVQNRLNDHLGFDNSIVTIPNGINLRKFGISQNDLEFDFKKDNNVILVQIASFREAKDQDTLIRALKYLPYNYHLILVGDGPRRIICENLVDQLRLSSQVHFLGIRMDIPQILNLANIVVVSSHYEGFGLAAIEGMASGKPVLATNVDGLKEVIDDPELLFEVGDYKTLSEKIKQIIEDSEFYIVKSLESSLRSEKYNIENTVNLYEKYYLSLFINKK